MLPLTDTRLPIIAFRMLPASEAVGVAASSVLTPRYVDVPWLNEVADAPPASGDSSIGLTEVESEKGFLTVDGLAGSGDRPPATDRYGGGAVAVDNGRGMGSAAIVVTACIVRCGPGGVTCGLASR